MTLQYSDVRSGKIDVDAQRALLRMSRVPGTSTDAAGMAAEVRGGRLEGIFVVSQKAPALRAKAMGIGWWQVIPHGRDSVLFLDPAAVKTRPPLIAFRGEVGQSPQRLDAALLTAWKTYQFFRSANATVCPPGSSGTPVAGVVPPVLCQLTPSTGPCRITTISVWLNAFIPQTAPGFTREVPSPPRGRTMLDTREGDCYLSNRRDFSSNPAASSMLHSRVDITVANMGMIERHALGPVTTVAPDTGRITCTDPGRLLQRNEWHAETTRDARSGTMTLSILGMVAPPCLERMNERARIFNLSAGVHLSMLIRPDPMTEVLVVSRSTAILRNLPAWELYIAVNGGTPEQVATAPPVGNMTFSHIRFIDEPLAVIPCPAPAARRIA